MKMQIKQSLLALVAAIAYATAPMNGAEPGYRGFFEYGYGFDTGSDHAFRHYNELHTTHGYQVIPQFFVGAGIGVDLYKGNYNYSELYYSIPLYLDLRYDVLTTRFSPFIDMKAGYAVAGDQTGWYVSPTAGCRMALDSHLGLNLGVGYLYRKNTEMWVGGVAYPSISGVCIRLGLDF